jgi:hypothetical protein
MTADGRRFVHGLDVTVYCSAPGFETVPAAYKIAAEWFAGGTRELKTFGFANDDCLERVYRDAVVRAAAIDAEAGELIGHMGVYRLVPNARDSELERLPVLEARLRG